MRKISLDDWTLFSERNNSRNYISKDGNRILKASSLVSEIKIEDCENDIRMSNDVADLGIPTPKTLEIVEIENGGIGLISEYIKDKKSISRAISEEPGKMEDFIRKYADLEKKIHETKCDKSKFISIEERINAAIEKKSIFTQDEIRNIKNVVESVPNTGTCLHVDSHYGNVISSPLGVFAIDLGSFSYGNPIYDLGLLYYLTVSEFTPEKAKEKIFHLNGEMLKKCWRYFLKYSQGIVDEREIEELENKITPFGFLSFLAISSEVNLGPIFLEHKKLVFAKYFQ